MAKRLLILSAAALVLLAGTAFPAAGARSGPAAVKVLSGLESGVLRELNAIRRAHGLAELRESRQLDLAARWHSFDLVRRGYFAHDSADGTPYWQRIGRAYPRGNARHYSVGENLLFASPTISARKAVEVWMESPPHRRAILQPSWREIGISAAASPSSPGRFHGAPVTVITLDFGVRR